jgi:hypothetical protein
MNNLNKVFALSALSLAVSTAYADGSDPADCSSMNDVNSLSYWSNPVLLTTCVLGNEPPAAGPGDNGPQVDTRDVGRHDSSSFEPEVQADSDPELHILMPEIEDEDSQFVGYFASYTRRETSEAGCEGYGCVVDSQIGSMLVEDINDSEDAGPDSFSVTRALDNGEVSDQAEYNASEDMMYVYANEGQLQHVEAWSYDSSPEGSSYKYEGYGVVPADHQLLTDYWAGFYNQSEYSNGGGYGDTIHGAAVFGVLTPLDDIRALVSSDQTLVYRGHSHLLNQEIDATLKMKEGTFVLNASDISGKATPRNDGGYGHQHYTQATPLGLGDQDISFTASGRIIGQHLVSDSITAVDTNDISGKLQGSIFGDNAAAIGGAYDINKQGTRITDTFTAAQDGVADQPWVGP